MPLSACLGPADLIGCPTGQLVGGRAPRCPACTAIWEHAHPQRRTDPAETAEHHAMLQSWVAVHGWYCPGLDDHPAHQVSPGQLSIHHLGPVAGGSQPRVGVPKTVLCLAENQRLGGQLAAQRRAEQP